MHIQNIICEQIDLFSPMDDKEFMQFVIHNCSQIFNREMFAVKNSNLEYIAISEEYATEFDLDNTHLGKKVVNTINDEKELLILQQEQEILEKYSNQDSIFFYQKNGITNYCGIRKRQLVNPSTNNIVGLLIVAGKFRPGLLRKYYLKLFVPPRKTPEINKDQKLTNNEQQIIFALLLGFHSRKEIASMLSNITNEEINEIKVKNRLNAVYQKFNCSNISQLLTLISNDQISLEFPSDIFASGNYPIE